jgi:hypothetical protein
MARQAKTQRIIDQAVEILTDFNPMTVRQVYYQLVSRQVVENNRSRYQAVSDALVDARLEGIIPWDWIEDRLRRPRQIAMWTDISDFLSSMIWRYNKDIWQEQPQQVEVWCEKDALSGIFSDVIADYGVILNVGRGYDGWSSIHNAAERYGSGENVTVLYFGDFDPSGEDMFRSLQERLGRLGSKPTMYKVALSQDDVQRYQLPPNFTKTTDTRRAGFVALYGDQAVELDALPATVLRGRIVEEIERHMDLDALKRIQEQEKQERSKLMEVIIDMRLGLDRSPESDETEEP